MAREDTIEQHSATTTYRACIKPDTEPLTATYENQRGREQEMGRVHRPLTHTPRRDFTNGRNLAQSRHPVFVIQNVVSEKRQRSSG